MKKALMIILLMAICVYATHKHYETNFCPAGGHTYTSDSWKCELDPCEESDQTNPNPANCGSFGGCDHW